MSPDTEEAENTLGHRPPVTSYCFISQFIDGSFRFISASWGQFIHSSGNEQSSSGSFHPAPRREIRAGSIEIDRPGILSHTPPMRTTGVSPTGKTVAGRCPGARIITQHLTIEHPAAASYSHPLLCSTEKCPTHPTGRGALEKPRNRRRKTLLRLSTFQGPQWTARGP